MMPPAPLVPLGALVERASAAFPDRWRPARSEAWWCLGVPVLLLVSLPVVYAVAPRFYRLRVLPEGYGFLEILHFLIPMTAALICFAWLLRPVVRAYGLLFAATALFGLACFYIGGEEHSWGQHLFKWDTPEYWSELNRQNETNLHNTSKWFNQIPEKVMQVGILIGGIILPLVAMRRPFEHWFLKLFVPPAAILPVAFSAAVAYSWGTVHEELGIEVVARSSEAAETFYYMFLLFYVIHYVRRLSALEAVRTGQPGQ